MVRFSTRPNTARRLGRPAPATAVADTCEGLGQRGDDGVGDLIGVRRSADVAGENTTAGGGFDPVRLGVQAEVIQRQRGADDRSDRVADPFAGDVGVSTTRRPAATTSLPTPSAGIAAILNVCAAMMASLISGGANHK